MFDQESWRNALNSVEGPKGREACRMASRGIFIESLLPLASSSVSPMRRANVMNGSN